MAAGADAQDDWDLDAALRAGIHHHQGGRLAEAERLYRTVLARRPNDEHALHLLGALAAQCGHPRAAIELIGRAIRINPDVADFHNNLALALIDAGELLDAERRARRALELRPESVPALSTLGVIVQRLGRPAEAVDWHRRAIELHGEDADRLTNLSIALLALGRVDEALSAARRATALDPRSAAARANFANALSAAGQSVDAVAALRQAIDAGAAEPRAWHNYLLYLHYTSDDAAAITAEHARWARGQPTAPPPPVHVKDSSPSSRPLRIGYVSPDFRRHPVTHFFEPVLAAHDRGQVEVFCYSNVAVGDATTVRLREGAGIDHWRHIRGMRDAEAADLIRRDGIDILVDLAVHSRDNRLGLFAARPAPVQVTWLGYCGTTGLPTVDYRLSDAIVNPPGLDGSYGTEQIVRLPDGFCCYQPPAESPDVVPLPADARGGPITFGSTNVLAKLTPDALDAWARILLTVPSSRLLMKAAGLQEAAMQERYRAAFAARGVADPDRLQFEGMTPFAEYLATFARIDVLLDPFPFNGHTTTCHALWHGVPVVTRSGGTPVSRVGRSLLSRIGLAELAAESWDGYVRQAVALASDPPRLRQLRNSLRDRMRASPLTGAVRFTRGLERVYRSLWASRPARGRVANPSNS